MKPFEVASKLSKIELRTRQAFYIRAVTVLAVCIWKMKIIVSGKGFDNKKRLKTKGQLAYTDL